MMTPQENKRAALYMDYENFYNSLLKRYSAIRSQTGNMPKIDFSQMVDFINEKYGSLGRGDFIAVADFSRFDAQKSGINKAATLVNVDVYDDLSKTRQANPIMMDKRLAGKGFVDLRLAFEIGHNSAQRPGDVHIIASNERIFASIGQALIRRGLEVVFLLPDPDKAAGFIKDNFDWIDFDQTQNRNLKEPRPAVDASQKRAPETDTVEVLCKAISGLRQEFSTAIPLSLIKAIFGSEGAERVIQKAIGQGRVDCWKDPNDVPCISRSEERVYNKVVPMLSRPEFVAAADLLYRIVQTAEGEQIEPSPADWRRLLQERAHLSARQSKLLVNRLIELDILRHGELARVRVNLSKAIQFIKQEMGKTEA